MTATSLLGLLAATLTTLAFLPQVLKTWRSRSARDVSTGMFLLLSVGVALWVIYGLLIGSLPVVAANAATLGLALAMLALKRRYRARTVT
jgi:MtN3 and saliva related transmembrane protein